MFYESCRVAHFFQLPAVDLASLDSGLYFKRRAEIAPWVEAIVDPLMRSSIMHIVDVYTYSSLYINM